ncbi:MAG: thiamine phosphate synthase [Lachnospiraceae bacterium]|nr:thiamine phosphate synthase [Lachnospiraceae bacterium]
MTMSTSDIICVTNRKLCREDFLTRIGRVAACRPAAVILREKDLSPSEYEALARQVMQICMEYGVPCVLHSFADTARLLGAQALHVPLPLLRAMPDAQKKQFARLGASCHSVEEALEAQRLGCTCITAGHVFDTDCKKGLPGRGLSFLREVCAASDLPVYGIGGIGPENIEQVREAGAAGACLMSSLMMCEDVEEYMGALGR